MIRFVAMRTTKAIIAATEISVKKYVRAVERGGPRTALGIEATGSHVPHKSFSLVSRRLHAGRRSARRQAPSELHPRPTTGASCVTARSLPNIGFLQRLLTIIPFPVSDVLKSAYFFGGRSLIQMAKPYVDDWLTARQSVQDALKAFSIFVFATNLSNTLAGGMDGSIDSRLALYNKWCSNSGTQVVDKDTEDLKNVAAPLGKWTTCRRKRRSTWLRSTASRWSSSLASARCVLAHDAGGHCHVDPGLWGSRWPGSPCE